MAVPGHASPAPQPLLGPTLSIVGRGSVPGSAPHGRDPPPWPRGPRPRARPRPWQAPRGVASGREPAEQVGRRPRLRVPAAPEPAAGSAPGAPSAAPSAARPQRRPGSSGAAGRGRSLEPAARSPQPGAAGTAAGARVLSGPRRPAAGSGSARVSGGPREGRRAVPGRSRDPGGTGMPRARAPASGDRHPGPSSGRRAAPPGPGGNGIADGRRSPRGCPVPPSGPALGCAAPGAAAGPPRSPPPLPAQPRPRTKGWGLAGRAQELGKSRSGGGFGGTEAAPVRKPVWRCEVTRPRAHSWW